MAKGKKGTKAKSKTITLKMAQECMELTLDEKRRLDLSFREISVLPKCLPKLVKIDELNLSRNVIRKLPEFTENFISVSVLDLHSNYLEELPASIGRLLNLQVLNLCNNRLTSLPSQIGQLKKLQTLYLGLNMLDALPSSIAALKELRHIGLSDNRFTRVPGCLCRLEKLEKVNLDGNPLQNEKTPSPDSAVVSERLHVVKKSFLCEDCLTKFQTEKEKLEAAERNEFKHYIQIKYISTVRNEHGGDW